MNILKNPVVVESLAFKVWKLSDRHGHEFEKEILKDQKAFIFSDYLFFFNHNFFYELIEK